MKFIISIIFIVGTGYEVEKRLINQDCETYWRERLVILERYKPKKFENHYVHIFEGQSVMGYICEVAETTSQ
jgi:hypothetical protein